MAHRSRELIEIAMDSLQESARMQEEYIAENDGTLPMTMPVAQAQAAALISIACSLNEINDTLNRIAGRLP